MANEESNILVVIDTQHDDNQGVLDKAMSLAKKLDVGVELFACAYDPHFFGQWLHDPQQIRKARAHLVVGEKKILDGLAKQFESEGIRTHTDVYWDMPNHEAVIRKIYRSKPELVVIKSEFRSAVDRALMSNDDWALIRSCPAPLYLARCRDKTDAKKTGIIWAAVDPLHEHDKPASLDDDIVREAKRMAEAMNAELHLYHTFDSTAVISAMAAGVLVVETIPSKEIHQQMHDQHLNKLTELAVKHDIPMDRVHNIAGSTRNVLPALAIERQPDLIVMGAVSRGFFKKLLLGSTAEKMLDKLPCDICIIKPERFQSDVATDSPHELRYRELYADKGAA